MKTRLLNVRKTVLYVLATLLLITLASCGGSKQVDGTKCTLRSDKVGLEISFKIPGDEYDWKSNDFEPSGSSVACDYSSADPDLDPKKKWHVIPSISVGQNLYSDILEAEEPYPDGTSIVETDNGLKWARIEFDDGSVRYATVFGEYLDGSYVVEINIHLNDSLEDGEEPDLDLRDKIEKTIINSFAYTGDYEGKPDHSDAAYTGSLLAKWPFEIPFEDGAIKAENYVENYKSSVKFTYDDPNEKDIIYEIFLDEDFIYDPNNYQNMTHMNQRYLGDDEDSRDEYFEEVEIADFRSAMCLNKEDHDDEIVVECGTGETDKRPILDFIIYTGSDELLTDANKKIIIDMVSAIVENAEFLK